MAIIVTGGTGKTGIRIAALLKQANISFVLTSRRGEAGAAGMPAVMFDWADPSTFPNPFQYVSEKITAVYLVGPQAIPDASGSVNSFIDYAVKEHGVKRFVMAGGTLIKKGNTLEMGKVWTHLDDIGVEYCVLRLTWSMGARPSVRLFSRHFAPLVRQQN
jgi:festuclavine dehydrogenase